MYSHRKIRIKLQILDMDLEMDYCTVHGAYINAVYMLAEMKFYVTDNTLK